MSVVNSTNLSCGNRLVFFSVFTNNTSYGTQSFAVVGPSEFINQTWFLPDTNCKQSSLKTPLPTTTTTSSLVDTVLDLFLDIGLSLLGQAVPYGMLIQPCHHISYSIQIKFECMYLALVFMTSHQFQISYY